MYLNVRIGSREKRGPSPSSAQFGSAAISCRRNGLRRVSCKRGKRMTQTGRIDMIAKPILYFRHEMVLVCDARCDKAWGINGRPRVELSATDEDDYAFLADD